MAPERLTNWVETTFMKYLFKGKTKSQPRSAETSRPDAKEETHWNM